MNADTKKLWRKILRERVSPKDVLIYAGAALLSLVIPLVIIFLLVVYGGLE